jgi:hypothetical protein
MKITVEQQLKMHSKVSREANHKVKPMVITDKKKQASKKKCRKKIRW